MKATHSSPTAWCSAIVWGTTKYKEQFMFLYRDAVVKMEETYQYVEPGDGGAFERPPFSVYFTCSTAAVRKLVLVGVHTKPEHTQSELTKLYGVVKEVKRKWQTNNIMLLGDFNADGRYLSAEDKKNISICTDEMFHWLIKDKEDTTTSTNNDYTYDRIVVFGKRMFDAVVPASAKAFNFQKVFRRSENDARKVSDHYPVEVELKEKQASG